jgi:hypothetical protein
LRRAVELIFFVAALGLLAHLLSRVGWAEVARALGEIGPGSALAIFLLGLAETVCDALALRVGLGNQISRFRVVTFHAMGSVANLFLPWELGEVVKGGLLRRDLGTEAMLPGLIVWNYGYKLSRPLTTAAAAVLGAVFSNRFAGPIEAAVLGASALAFLPYLGLKLLLAAGPAAALSSALGKVSLVKDAPALTEAARRVDSAVRDFTRNSASGYAKLLSTQVAGRVFSFCSLWVAVNALGLPFGLGDVALIYAGLNVAELVLAALPARLGVNEGAAFALFAAFGLDPGTGLLVYLVLRIRSLVANGVLAPFAWLGGGKSSA